MSNWEKRFDEFYSANFIDTDLRVGSRKQEREKIKTYISKHLSRVVAKERKAGWFDELYKL